MMLIVMRSNGKRLEDYFVSMPLPSPKQIASSFVVTTDLSQDEHGDVVPEIASSDRIAKWLITELNTNAVGALGRKNHGGICPGICSYGFPKDIGAKGMNRPGFAGGHLV
jgi:hypothetical protein